MRLSHDLTHNGVSACGVSRSMARRVCMKRVRVLLADKHPPLLHHLSACLSDDFCIVGAVSEGKSLLTTALKLQPQVIISDIDMPIMNGLESFWVVNDIITEHIVSIL